MSSAVPQGESSFDVHYTKGGDANPLRGVSSGPEVGDFWYSYGSALDATPPALVGGSVAGTSVTLYYDKALDTDSTPAPGDFTVTAASSTRTVSSVSMSETAVTLTLGSAVSTGQTVTVTYRAGTNPIRDLAGNNAANLTNKEVTNRGSTDPGKPALAATDPAVVNGRVLTLTYNQPFDPTKVPAKEAFTVLGPWWSVTGVAVRGQEVELSLSRPVFPCTAAFAVSYAKPSANALRNVWGTQADGFTELSVTNAQADQCDPSSSWLQGTEIGSVILTARRSFATDEQPRSEWFTVEASRGPVTVTEASVSPGDLHELKLALSRDIASDETVTVSYTRPPQERGLWDVDGKQLGDVLDRVVANEAPPAEPSGPAFDDGEAAALAIDENHADGAEVGTVAATDEDGDALTYSLSGEDAASFTIGAGGEIAVASGTTLDFEAQASYAFTAAVTDGEDADGNAEDDPAADATIAVTVAVGNVEEPPGAPTGVTVEAASTTALSVGWAAPADTGALDVAGYDLRWFAGEADPADASDWTETGDVGAETASTIADLAEDMAYRVQVRARGDGAGPWSASGSGRTAAPVREELTASFHDVPSEHGGKDSEFSFELRFSEDMEGAPHLRRSMFKDGAIETSGKLINVARAPRGQSQHWTITVRPLSDEPVSVTLAATGDCAAAAAICTPDGRPLSNTTTATVAAAAREELTASFHDVPAEHGGQGKAVRARSRSGPRPSGSRTARACVR